MPVYREAKTIVGAISGGGPGEEAIDSVALAIQRGVSPTALRELYHDVSPGAEVIFHSAQAMADLKDLGFSESQGRRMVEAAVNAGYFTHEEPLFTAVVSKARKSGFRIRPADFRDDNGEIPRFLQRSDSLSNRVGI